MKRRSVAVVTGAASGIGAATAERLAADGAVVHCSDSRLDALEARWGGRDGIHLRAVDVRVPEDVEAAFDSIGGQLDMVAHIAGVQRAGLIDAQDPADWHLQLAVNLTGTWLVNRAAVKALKAQGGGAIVNMASLAGLKGAGSGMSAYSATKVA